MLERVSDFFVSFFFFCRGMVLYEPKHPISVCGSREELQVIGIVLGGLTPVFVATVPMTRLTFWISVPCGSTAAVGMWSRDSNLHSKEYTQPLDLPVCDRR
jgi:hypothetical protein